MPAELSPDVYRAVLESFPAAIYLVDRNRQIVLWNSAAEDITGYLRQEVIGRYCNDNLLMHCDDRQNILCGAHCPLMHTMHDGQPRETEVFLRHKDGQRVPVRVRARPVHGADGEIVGAVEWFEERSYPGEQGPRLVEDQPTLDDVTETPDAPAMRSLLSSALDEFYLSKARFGILSFAIDGLENLRRTLGQHAIEAILYATGQTLASNLRGPDSMGRWPDDRFLAIVGCVSAGALFECAERMRRMAAMAAVPWWGDRLSFTISAGGTIVRAGDTPDSIVHRAEQALLSAIACRPDCVQVV